MRVPLSWLRDHIDPARSPEDLAELLWNSGTEVESIESRVPETDGNLEHFRVGFVREAVQHPDADRLRVCTVDVGESEPRTIVCGAPNVAAGQHVPVALPGAVLPGRPPLGTAKLRGVTSHGMILSASELGLSDESAGIIELATDAAPGTRLDEVLPIVETVFDLEVTSNRPDCQSVYGIAREVHAVTGAELRPLDESEPAAEGPGTVDDHVTLRVEAPDLCPRYLARVFTDVEVAPSPDWLRGRVEAAGMRSINNVVDVTNYVMLLTGQPLHAFDLDAMAGPAVVVRRATEGEPVTTLDDQARTLDADMLAICDAERPSVIAGIMGAADVEVSGATTRILLEAATFDGATILNTSLRLGLRSESSARFERGLSPKLPPRAMAIASRLLVEVCGAKMVPGTLDAAAPIEPEATLELRFSQIERVLGIEVPEDRATEILARLGFAPRPHAQGLAVTVPFERSGDVTREIDLVEEIGRVHGYEHVPAELPKLVGTGRRSPAQQQVVRLSRLACDLGFNEAISYRFVPEGDADRLLMADDDPRRDVVRLEHPMSEEMAVMRQSMLPGLLRAAARNQRHQRPAGRLFEVGRTYAPQPDGMAREREFLAALMFGQPVRDHWRAPQLPVDIHAATGIATRLCAAVGVHPGRGANQAPYFHPVRQLRLTDGDTPVAWVGEIHPKVLKNFDVTEPAAAIVIDLGALLAARPTEAPQFVDLLTVPVSLRDIACVVDDTVAVGDLVATAADAGGALVREVRVVDRYAGEQVGAGKVSIALRLEIVDPGATLTDEQISTVVDTVRDALEARHGASLRE